MCLILLSQDDSSPPTHHSPPTPQKKTQRQRAWKDEQFSAWDGSHYKTVQYVKNKMHNPKSFEHVQTGFIDKATEGHRIIVMTYRGTNLFNAVVTETKSFKVSLNGDVLGEITTK